MSARAASLTGTWAVGRYTATLTAGPNDDGMVTAVCEWLPHMPRTLTPREKEDYQSGLAAFATELGQMARQPNPSSTP
ncbi:hypothetical protein ABIC83_001786 [Roseateles asaccharophilus]|uniref:Uncharacterized protein n=1 Tax=Roseateles asaccharophilus TaxID=582607 RepID=A0ABU2A4B8_9BURK|nr:hypothetical protein [Roseateles asaccharophilus]